MMQFNGKAGLVTGGGSGIGRATAIGFARLGGRVAVADINGENANKVAAEIAGAGGKAIAIVCDVTRACGYRHDDRADERGVRANRFAS